MPQPDTVDKARLIEMWPSGNGELTEQGQGGKAGQNVPVQFNPQTLKTNYTNQNANADKGGGSQQFVGTGTTKLTMELWFDATRLDQPGAKEAGGDVRKMTDRVRYFITPQLVTGTTNRVLPGLKFVWGSLLFQGVMDTMDETIELFSKTGIPLRASVSIGITKQEITQIPQDALGAIALVPGGAGRTPLKAAGLGDTLQQLAAKAGISDWQRVAAANGIENPRLVPPGTLLDLSLR